MKLFILLWLLLTCFSYFMSIYLFQRYRFHFLKTENISIRLLTLLVFFFALTSATQFPAYGLLKELFNQQKKTFSELMLSLYNSEIITLSLLFFFILIIMLVFFHFLNRRKKREKTDEIDVF